MGEPKRWYVVAYDVRDPARWRKVYKVLRGFGVRVQYSVFRCKLSERQLEHLRWELEKRLEREDSLLVIGLCEGCAARVAVRNGVEAWESEDPGFRVL